MSQNSQQPVASSQKRILHIDMNSYFATVEQQANPKLRGKPVAVLGSKAKRTIIVASSIEAKRFGVKTGFNLPEALELCPEIVVIHGEPRKYSDVTRRFIKIFEDYTDKVEIFSIDEAFLDVTETAHLFEPKSSLRKNEMLSFRHCESDLSGAAISIPLEKLDRHASARDDDLLGAIEIAKVIKKRIRSEIGSWISCSVGIGPNKFLAKTGSDLEKPDGLVIINNSNKDEILLSLPLKDFCGIGRRIERRLAMMGIKTTKELRKCPVVILKKEFGICTAQKLKSMAHGIDSFPVISWRDQPPAKSFSCSRTLNRDVVSRTEIKNQIQFLFEKVAKKLRDDGYFAREISLWIRFKDFGGTGKSMRIGHFSCDGTELYKLSLTILDKLDLRQPVRAIGVCASMVQLKNNVPLSLLPEDVENEKIVSVIDKVNNRYGEDVIRRANLADKKLKEVVSGMGREKF